jgi:hypothetical protein
VVVVVVGLGVVLEVLEMEGVEMDMLQPMVL